MSGLIRGGALRLSSIASSVAASTSSAADVSMITLSSNQSISQNTNTLLALTGTAPTGMTLSGGVLTTTVAGKYSLTGFVQMTTVGDTAGTTYYTGILYKNGSALISQPEAYPTPANASASMWLAVNITLWLNVGDTVGLYAKASPGAGNLSTATALAGCFLNVAKVG